MINNFCPKIVPILDNVETQQIQTGHTKIYYGACVLRAE